MTQKKLNAFCEGIYALKLPHKSHLTNSGLIVLFSILLGETLKKVFIIPLGAQMAAYGRGAPYGRGAVQPVQSGRQSLPPAQEQRTSPPQTQQQGPEVGYLMINNY